MVDNSPIGTKWNFDEERMKAISAYMVEAEESFSSFSCYRGIAPVEDLHNKLGSVKRAIIGTGSNTDSKEIKKKFIELEKVKRECNDIILGDMPKDKKRLEFVKKSTKFYNVAEEFWELINQTNTRNGLYFRRKEDPRRAVEMH